MVAGVVLAQKLAESRLSVGDVVKNVNCTWLKLSTVVPTLVDAGPWTLDLCTDWLPGAGQILLGQRLISRPY